jgi:hypothetical protein
MSAQDKLTLISRLRLKSIVLDVLADLTTGDTPHAPLRKSDAVHDETYVFLIIIIVVVVAVVLFSDCRQLKLGFWCDSARSLIEWASSYVNRTIRSESKRHKLMLPV